MQPPGMAVLAELLPVIPSVEDWGAQEGEVREKPNCCTGGLEPALG